MLLFFQKTSPLGHFPTLAPVFSQRLSLSRLGHIHILCWGQGFRRDGSRVDTAAAAFKAGGAESELHWKSRVNGGAGLVEARGTAGPWPEPRAWNRTLHLFPPKWRKHGRKRRYLELGEGMRQALLWRSLLCGGRKHGHLMRGKLRRQLRIWGVKM